MTSETFERNLNLIRESIYRGNVSDGITKLTSILEDAESLEERTEVSLDIVMLSLACGDMEEAISRWNQVRRYHDKTDCRIRAFDAFFCMIHEDKDNGLAKFETCLLEQPENFEFYFLRGLAYGQSEQYEHALADLERANTLSVNNILIMSVMADIYAELNQEQRAIGMHEAVLQMCPDYRRSLMSLGVLYFDRQQFESAFKLFQCLVGYDPVNWFAWACLGDIRLMQPGRSLQAMPYYAASVVTGAQLSQPYLNLARGLYCLGKYPQGLRVLKKFEANFKTLDWPKDDYKIYQFLLLIGECIVDGRQISKDLSERIKPIKNRVDHEIERLLNILCTVSSVKISDRINTIFFCHIRAFVELAEYMRRCNGRVVEIDETILLGSIARIFIWNGFLFEARAILGLLSKSDDVLAMDMTALLWKEFYDFGNISSSIETHPELFHKEIIESPEIDTFVTYYLENHLSEERIPVVWRKIMSDCLIPGYDQLTDYLFGIPDETPFALLNQLNHKNEKKDLNSNKLWSLYQSHCMAGNQAPSLKDSGLNETEYSVLIQLEKMYQSSKSDGKSVSSEGDIQFGKILCSVLGDRNISAELVPSNQDVVQVCANDPQVALGGYDPLPFALDGVSIKKYLRFKHSDHLLDESGLSATIRQWMMRYLISVLIPESPEILKKYLSEETLLSFARHLSDLSLAIHGHKPVLREFFLDDNGQIDNIFIQLLKRSCHKHEAIKHLIYLAQNDLFPESGIQLPLSKIPHVHYIIPKVPEIPQISSVMSSPVVNVLISRNDLYELFFNRAVLAVENWLNSQNSEDLSIFFSGKNPYKFRAIQIPAPRQKHRIIISKNRIKHNVPHLTETASNTDREQTMVVRMLDKSRKRQRLREDKPTPDIIRNTENMAEALNHVCEALKQQPVIAMSFEFSPCVRNHPFLQQFKYWAETQSEQLWPEIESLSRMLETISVTGPYVVRWRVMELIKRYPWLSPLYILLAGLYTEQGEDEKAMQAIYSGLAWDERLYAATGWYPVQGDNSLHDTAIDPIEAQTELEESRDLLWSERYIFLNNEENMYHYGDIMSGYHIRYRRPIGIVYLLQPLASSDKRGCYDFYRLFRKFIVQDGALKTAYLNSIRKPGVYSLEDYMVSVIQSLDAPEEFPLRRQLAEMLFQLYPEKNPGSLGHFYCDNLQPANALLYASYAYLSETTNEVSDDPTQSAVTLGCLFYDMGFMDDALKYLKTASRSRNPSPMAFLTLGCVLIEMRRFHQAIRYLQDGLKLDPTSDRFYYNMALAYIEIGELDEAENAIKAGIELSKYPVDLKMQLARIYVKEHKFTEALPLMKYVSEEDPDMFLTAIKFVDFQEFSRLKAVQELVDSCMIGQRP